MAVGSTRTAYTSFAGQLNAGELLTGSVTVEEIGTSDLTISGEAVTTAEVDINGEEVPLGKAVQFSVADAQAGVTYKLKITVSTNATPAQTLIGNILFAVEC